MFVRGPRALEQLSVEGDVRLIQLGDGTACLRVLDGGVECFLGGPGDTSFEIQVTFCDGESIGLLFERNRARGFKAFGGQSGLRQLG